MAKTKGARDDRPSSREDAGAGARACQRGAAAGARAKLGRPGQKHHQGHPAVSERTYSDEEHEVLKAMDAHKARTGRRFPTVCDYLAVFRALGYRRDGDAR